MDTSSPVTRFLVFRLKEVGSFPSVPQPSLMGAYYLQPPGARAIFLHNDLLCNWTCSVTGGTQTETIQEVIGGNLQLQETKWAD